jgi:F0F1-type ATP synthase epsilon subunit
MLVLIHVFIAFSSIAIATLSVVVPSQRILRANYVLIAATLLSGTFLVWQTHAPLVSACLSGIVYLTVAVSLTAFARHRFNAIRKY